MQNNNAEVISQGVETLIARLQQQGVTAGKQEADALIQQAQSKANKILQKAKNEAETLINEAHEKIQKEKRATEDSLELAARNIRLELRQRLIDRFKEEVKRLIHKQLSNEDTIRQFILILAGDTAEQLQKFKNTEITFQLPDNALDFEKIRNNPKLLENDPLKLLVQGVMEQILREGLTIKYEMHHQEKICVKAHIVDEDVEVDISEDAISDLLLKHLQPRFRALLEGLLH